MVLLGCRKKLAVPCVHASGLSNWGEEIRDFQVEVIITFRVQK